MDDTAGRPSANESALVRALLAGDRAALARAITMVESAARQHAAPARALLAQLLPYTGKSIRIGVTGPPGAGKSTFIDTFGAALTERGLRVAVLAIDPSSAMTGGSILGDKTRMEKLSRAANAFIRPSPTSGALGGVAGKTREAILVCEAAGYNVIIVETVGAGQNEIALRSMVDCLLLLLITGAGDELQGIKKGVIEIADAIIINKADGDNIAAAHAARAQFERALRFVAPATSGWRTRALAASGLAGAGINEIWTVVSEFKSQTKSSGAFEQRRTDQRRQWLHSALERQLRDYLYRHEAVRAAMPAIEAAVMAGEIPAAAAAEELLRMALPG
ncbi:MAG: methylmalonyl Co-A mutase-associated GTPase MeaB [Chloroflexota bacterium]|nr:methylmalonyl Co-A mutase-associated GTPase MeaB [Chloroflexota bacterium]MDE2909630.1 methylmalonyl Co-A mutase-associated GTPase MeaB [Chloroflexota bacterium]